MSQFVKATCRAMERIAPLRLAESWDNVGLLLEAPPKANARRKVFLTIDLTSAVAQEAIKSQASIVISYHAPIFRPLSSLILSNPIQRSLLHLAQEGISVYTPHTALDSVKGGVNDWIAEVFVRQGITDAVEYLQDKNDVQGGAGRLVRFQDNFKMDITGIVNMVKAHLGLEQVQLARPDADPDRLVKTVAICAGSGGSMFQGVEADLYLTGEMQHHEVLAAIARNSSVLLCGHTNTERGYLPVLKQKLLSQQSEDPNLEGLEVEISATDAHPLAFV